MDPKDATREILANLMVGRDVELKVVKGPADPKDIVLSIKDLHVRDDRGHMAVKNVNLEVRAGEIVALAGVQGNGQTELVEAIVGLRVVDSGELLIEGKSITRASPRQVSDMGVAHVPEDRMRDGLIGAMTVAENFILDTYHREPYSKGGRLNAKAIEERATIAVKDYDVRTPGIDTFAGSLSGGNQQKVVVAREFSRPVTLVVAAQPTRGLLVVKNTGPYRMTEDLRDQSIATPDPIAVAALAVQADMAALGLRRDIDYQIMDYGSHLNAVMQVINGRTAAAMLGLHPYKLLPAEIRKQLRIVAETTPLSSLMYLTHPRLRDQEANAIRRALLDFATTPQGKAFLQHGGYGGFVPVDGNELRAFRPYALQAEKMMQVAH